MRTPRRRKPAVTEAHLRRIIREELARQHLVNEGFLDVLKSPFKSLSDKVKAEISKKTEEILNKLGEVMNSLKSGPMGEVKEFLKALEAEEQGGSVEELLSQVPELEQLASDVNSLKELDPKELIAADSPQKAEGINSRDLTMQFVLLDEHVKQLSESYQKNSKTLLTESVILTALSAWWTFEKTVVGGLGLLYWTLKFLAWTCDKLGLPNAAKSIKKYADKVHHLEDAVIETTAFPPPLQYAAYAAYMKMKKEKPLSYKEFNDPKNKDAKAMKKDVFKVLKFALLMPMILDAAYHLGQSLAATLQNFGDVSKAVKYTAKVASETGAAAKVAPFGDVGAAAAKTAAQV